MDSNSSGTPPNGCGPSVSPLYFLLCDLGAVWGVVLEAVAAAGLLTCLVLLVALLSRLPSAGRGGRCGSVALQAGFLVASGGLFGLTFAFIVGEDSSTCASRRFLFGVLFAACFSCLLMQSVRLNIVAWRGAVPPAWKLCLGALALWLVEVVINTEWLILTELRRPDAASATPCGVENQDFVMALIYVMVLMLAVLWASLAVVGGPNGKWRKDGAFIFITGLMSTAIWVTWIVMFLFGNQRTGGSAWDDPTLAIALVTNAWTFVLLHTVPEVCSLGGADSQQDYREDLDPGGGVGYQTILKEQGFKENKAFSLDENLRASKPESPYSGYSGTSGLRSAVYQPTELALMSKAPAALTESPDMIIPRASAHNGRSQPSTYPESGNVTHTQPSGQVLQGPSQW